MRSLPWPEMPSKQVPGRTIRALLDYLVWISKEMRQIGFHAGTDRDEWCRRVQRAYAACFIPIFPGHGDPYPPDIPPARNPGIWPDIPAATIAGMTLRHQLTVIEMLTRTLRQQPWRHARSQEVQEWDRRLALTYAELDHGEYMPMPEDAQTEASEEGLEAAAATQAALRAKARRRSQQLRRQLQARKTAPKKKAAPPKEAVAPASAEKKVAAKKTAKKAAAKKTAKKKAAPKKTAKKKAAKKTAKKKAAPKKTAKKKAKRS